MVDVFVRWQSCGRCRGVVGGAEAWRCLTQLAFAVILAADVATRLAHGLQLLVDRRQRRGRGRLEGRQAAALRAERVGPPRPGHRDALVAHALVDQALLAQQCQPQRFQFVFKLQLLRNLQLMIQRTRLLKSVAADQRVVGELTLCGRKLLLEAFALGHVHIIQVKQPLFQSVTLLRRRQQLRRPFLQLVQQGRHGRHFPQRGLALQVHSLGPAGVCR
mmetsp:Transcript_49835/g.151682  ORF Transcript_49835/g.151682 Transcript_49835/m.151682 type:complete len:218 (-) Transcript_49835:52-705(-)